MLVDPDGDLSKFNNFQKREAIKLQHALKTQGLPEEFLDDGHVQIRRADKTSKMVYISNWTKPEQKAMLNNGRLELYWVCPECMEDGFKNTLIHKIGCSYETKPFGK